MRFSGIMGELVGAAAVGAFGRFGREDLGLPAGLEPFCCGVVGNDDRRRGVPFMA